MCQGLSMIRSRPNVCDTLTLDNASRMSILLAKNRIGIFLWGKFNRAFKIVKIVIKVCVCVRERERERERECVCVCMAVKERESVCMAVKERETEFE